MDFIDEKFHKYFKIKDEIKISKSLVDYVIFICDLINNYNIEGVNEFKELDGEIYAKNSKYMNHYCLKELYKEIIENMFGFLVNYEIIINNYNLIEPLVQKNHYGDYIINIIEAINKIHDNNNLISKKFYI